MTLPRDYDEWRPQGPEEFYTPTEEDEKDFWSGKGHIEFFVIQNVPGTFEIEVTDCSGCAHGMQETIGIDYYISDVWCLQNDPRYPLREGVTYTLHDLTVQWYRGDGWNTDDDVEYDFDDMTHDATALGYLWHKAKMIWWRKVGCRLRNRALRLAAARRKDDEDE